MGLFEECVPDSRGAVFPHTGKEIGRAGIEVDLKRIADDNKCQANDSDHLFCFDRAEGIFAGLPERLHQFFEAS